jgi:hypothetical protein
MSNKIYFLITLLVILSTNSFASNTDAGADKQDKKEWYAHWGLGFPMYSGIDLGDSEDSKFYEKFSEEADLDVGLNSDLFGFYFPVNPQILVGFILNASAKVSTEKKTIVVGKLNYSLSSMYFFKGAIAEGPYVRGDLGYGEVSFTSNIDDESRSGGGIGYGIGGGYAIPKSSISLSLMYFNASSEVEIFREKQDLSVSTFQISLGWLW